MKPVIFAIISYYIIGSIKSSCEKRPFHWTTVWPMEENYVTYKLVGPITNNKNASVSGTASFNNAVAESLTHYEQISTSGPGLVDNDYIESNSFLAKPVSKHTSRKVYRDPELNECHVSKEKKDGTCLVKDPVSSAKRANHPKVAVDHSNSDSSEFNQMEETAYDDDIEFVEKPTYAASQKVKNTQFKNYQHPIPQSAAYSDICKGKMSPYISKRFYGVNENARLSRFKGANSEYRNDPTCFVKDNVISQCKMQKTKKNLQGKRVNGIAERRDFLKKGRLYPRQNIPNPKISRPKAQRHWQSSYARGNRSIKSNMLVNQSDLQNGQLTNIGDKGVMEEDKSPAHSWLRDLTPWFKSS